MEVLKEWLARRGGRGDVGESHRYSEEEKSTTYGKPDTKGSGPKLTLNDWKCNMLDTCDVIASAL